LYKERERGDEKTLQQILHSIQVVALLASWSIGSLQSPSWTTALAGATIVAVATKDEEMETGAEKMMPRWGFFKTRCLMLLLLKISWEVLH
jgi:hypothetical protein